MGWRAPAFKANAAKADDAPDGGLSCTTNVDLEGYAKHLSLVGYSLMGESGWGAIVKNQCFRAYNTGMPRRIRRNQPVLRITR